MLLRASLEKSPYYDLYYKTVDVKSPFEVVCMVQLARKTVTFVYWKSVSLEACFNSVDFSFFAESSF